MSSLLISKTKNMFKVIRTTLLRINNKTRKRLRSIRRDVVIQALLPQLERTLYSLLRYDQGQLTRLLSQDPQRKDLIDEVRKSLRNNSLNLAMVIEGSLSEKDEAALFEKVSEDWEICKAIARKRGKVLKEYNEGV